MTFLLSSLASVLQVMTGNSLVYLPIVGGLVVWLALVLPQCAALARRMHDTGHGTWWAVAFALSMVTYYVSYIILMWNVKDELVTGAITIDTAGMIADAFKDSMAAVTVMIISSLLTMVLGLVTLIFSLIDSKVEANKYGISPKYQ